VILPGFDGSGDAAGGMGNTFTTRKYRLETFSGSNHYIIFSEELIAGMSFGFHLVRILPDSVNSNGF
jgi:hypothetical protein